MTQHETDDLEHASGLRPLGEYPDHCERCALGASCAHEDVVELSAFGQGVVARHCSRCGMKVEA